MGKAMQDIKGLLDKKLLQYNRPSFIDDDPVSIPHAFTRKEDIEIAGFFAATFAWGNRKSIIKTSFGLMNRMDNQPYEFIMNAGPKEMDALNNFTYRTFNGTDCRFFVNSIRNIYTKYQGMEQVFWKGFQQNHQIKEAIIYFKNVFFSVPHPKRSVKHVANPSAGSAAKRINLFLRWMVRNDGNGVDFGIWQQLPMSALMIPLDLHSGNTARKLGLLHRKQNDWKSVEELTAKLRDFDPSDPVKYDFALFGMGAIN